MKFRKSEITDVNNIINLFLSVYKKMPYKGYLSEKEWGKFIKNNYSYVLEENKIIIGHAGLIILDNTGILCGAAVLQGHRQHGYYDIMLKKRLEICSRENVLKIDTHVTTHTTKVQHKLSEKYNFKAVGLELFVIEDIMGMGQKGSLVHMRKYLREEKEIALPKPIKNRVPYKYNENTNIWKYKQIPTNCDFSKIHLTSQTKKELNITIKE